MILKRMVRFLSWVSHDCFYCCRNTLCRPHGVAANFRNFKTSRGCHASLLTSWNLRIYPYPMVWPLPRTWSQTMVWIPLWAQKTLETKGFLGLERPFLDLVSQTPRPRGRGRPFFAEPLSLPPKKRPCHACLATPLVTVSTSTARGVTWESAKVSHKRVFALLTPEICS